MNLNRLRQLAGLPQINESTDVIKNNDVIVLFSDWAKEHITQSHKQMGMGSVFAKGVNLDTIAKAIEKLNISKEGGVFQTKISNIGYDLVLPIDDANKLPDAQVGTATKQERGKDVKVPMVTTSAPLQQFATNDLSVVIRPTSAEYLPDDVKQDEQIVQATKEGKVYSVLSAWPGKETPPASQWNNKYAVIVPKGA